MDLLKITQKFEMTQQIRTISRANGLRRLTIITAYHNRGTVARRSNPHPSLDLEPPSSLDDIANGCQRKVSRHVDQQFLITDRITLSRILTCEYSLIHFPTYYPIIA
ncbi:hypothetical protein P5V15_004430 [Pogonomyrmex californicus]